MSSAELSAFLEELGLTEYEAKALTSLFRLKEAEAPQISRNSQVPKTRVYDVLERLTKKGLIIEVSGRPKKYKSLETEKAFDLLLDDMKSRVRKLEEKSVVLKNSIVAQPLGTEFEKVLKVKEKADFAKILVQEIESAKISIHGFSNMLSENTFLADAMQKAADKNIGIRLLSGPMKKGAGDFTKKGIELRETSHSLEAFIVDGKKVILSISDLSQEKPGYHFTIWPNNLHMASALTHYFEKLWEEAK